MTDTLANILINTAIIGATIAIIVVTVIFVLLLIVGIKEFLND